MMLGANARFIGAPWRLTYTMRVGHFSRVMQFQLRHSYLLKMSQLVTCNVSSPLQTSLGKKNIWITLTTARHHSHQGYEAKEDQVWKQLRGDLRQMRVLRLLLWQGWFYFRPFVTGNPYCRERLCMIDLLFNVFCKRILYKEQLISTI
jgi:hypothetical protein